MRKNTLKSRIMHLVFLASFILLMTLPVHAEIDRTEELRVIKLLNSALIIKPQPDSQIIHINNVTNNDRLTRAVQDFLLTVKNSINLFKERQLDQEHKLELNNIKMDVAKDIMRRKKIIQMEQRRAQKDRIQAIKAKNRDLNQRLRDLSRR